MKIIVAGSREITDYEVVEKTIFRSGWSDEITEIVSGGARGVDRLGEIYGRLNKIHVFVMKALWDKEGKAAGPLRNIRMAEYADGLIAIWDGKSRGTAHMIKTMKAYNKPVFVMEYHGDQKV